MRPLVSVGEDWKELSTGAVWRVQAVDDRAVYLYSSDLMASGMVFHEEWDDNWQPFCLAG